MKILISNDDGYKAPGIHVLARAMEGFGEVTVVAPKYHQSAMSLAVSLGVKQLAYKDLPEEKPGRWMYLDATPGSCVKFGLEFCYPHRDPDVLVCGVNHGTNASTAANYSATLGAAEEGAINGIKSIGVSLCDFGANPDFSAVSALLPSIVKDLLENWPENHWGLYYNVNFPAIPLETIKGIRFTRQGRGHWEREFEQWDEEKLSQSGLSDSFLWQHKRVQLEPGEKACFMVGDFLTDDQDPSTADHLLLEEGYVTITPCTASLTDMAEYERRKNDIIK